MVIPTVGLWGLEYESECCLYNDVQKDQFMTIDEHDASCMPLDFK
jgi:hypothetical protein